MERFYKNFAIWGAVPSLMIMAAVLSTNNIQIKLALISVQIPILLLQTFCFWRMPK